MAVSNSIGSNVFDILVGLGLPWALQTLAIDYGSVVSNQQLCDINQICCLYEILYMVSFPVGLTL